MKDVLVDTSLGVEISIKDINDNPPRFLRDLYEINLSEGDPQGTDYNKPLHYFYFLVIYNIYKV